MTHTKHRKRRARFIFQVERIYPALIEGRMARGHRAVGALLPWSPKLHGWRDGGYVTDADKLPDDRPAWAVFIAPLGTPPPGWSGVR